MFSFSAIGVEATIKWATSSDKSSVVIIPSLNATILCAISAKAEAEGFYAEHSERGFFGDLVAFMTSGPVVVQVLEGENAIARNRELMGATNPKEAAAGTIRADFAESIDANAVHGSDSEAAAAREIAYFFAATEVTTR